MIQLAIYCCKAPGEWGCTTAIAMNDIGICPWVCPNSCPLSWWCYLIILYSATHISFCLQSFLASGSFPKSQLLASGGQSIGTPASVLPMNIQGWPPLGLTGLISLLSKGLSRVFSNSTVGKYQFFGTQPSLWFIRDYDIFQHPRWPLCLFPVFNSTPGICFWKLLGPD